MRSMMKEAAVAVALRRGTTPEDPELAMVVALHRANLGEWADAVEFNPPIVDPVREIPVRVIIHGRDTDRELEGCSNPVRELVQIWGSRYPSGVWMSVCILCLTRGNVRRCPIDRTGQRSGEETVVAAVRHLKRCRGVVPRSR